MAQLTLFNAHVTGYVVQEIHSTEAHDMILNYHYAKRIPSITYAYGLFYDAELVGVVTYGTPPSSTLCRGVCGDQYQSKVVELNRLVLKYNKTNEASKLVGASLRLLPQPTIVVSFADTAQNHTGYVYQATNFLYTGLSSAFRDPRVKGLEHQHHTTYAHGMTNKQVIEKYGDENVYFVDRSRKHRYVTFVGNKTQKKELRQALRYKVLPYPKQEQKR
jgi:hypothetical protein